VSIGHLAPRSEVSGHFGLKHFGPKVQHAGVKGRLGGAIITDS